MAELLLFHHAQGRTAGCLSFADELRAAGHVAHAPDLYDGRTFADLDDGVGYAREVGFDTIGERGRLAAEGLPNEIVYAGADAGPDEAGCQGSPIAPRLRPALGVRGRLAAGRPASDPPDGSRRVGSRGRPRRRPRDRREGGKRRAVPVPRRSTPVR